jgi:hypothetical protein
MKCTPHDANQTGYCQVPPPYLPVRFNTASRIEPYTSARRDRERPGRARWQDVGSCGQMLKEVLKKE